MRKVVDAGFLRSDSIIEYLTADRANELVLTDYLCMESLKGWSTTNFLQQIKHIYKFTAKSRSSKAPPNLQTILAPQWFAAPYHRPEAD